MVSVENYFSNVTLVSEPANPISTRTIDLLHETIEELPDHDTFRMRGIIMIDSTSRVNKVLIPSNPTGIVTPIFTLRQDGSCTYTFGRDLASSKFAISIMTDSFNDRSDDSIKYSIDFQYGELSLAWRTHHDLLMQNLPPLEHNELFDSLTHADAPLGSWGFLEHERLVREEIIRLGLGHENT